MRKYKVREIDNYFSGIKENVSIIWNDPKRNMNSGVN